VFGLAGLKICEFSRMIDGRWYVAVCWRGWSVRHCVMKLFQGNSLKGTNCGAWVVIQCWQLNSSAPYYYLYAIIYKAFSHSACHCVSCMIHTYGRWSFYVSAGFCLQVTSKVQWESSVMIYMENLMKRHVYLISY